MPPHSTDPLAALPAPVRALVGQGQYDAARVALAGYVEAHPDDAGARHVLGEMLYMMGDRAAAEAVLRRLSEDHPDHIGGLTALATLLVRSDRHRDALPLLERAVAAAPGDDRARALLAHVQGRLGGDADIDGTIRRYEALLREGRSARLLNDLATQLMKAGRTAEAEAHLREAIALEPAYPVPHVNLFSLLSGRGDWPAAEAEARRAVEAAGDDPTLQANLADALIMLNRPGEACAVAHAALPRHPEHRRLAAAAVRGDHLRGRMTEALATADAVLARDPGNADVHRQRSAILSLLDRHDEAMAAAEGAIAAEPSAASYMQAATTARSAKRFRESLLHAVRGLLADGDTGIADDAVEAAVVETDDLPEPLYAALAGIEGMSAEMQARMVFLCCVAATVGCHRPMQRLRPLLAGLTDMRVFGQLSFVTNYDPHFTAEDLAEHYIGFSRRAKAAAPAAPARLAAEPAKRVLRVGLLSGDFRQHVVMKFVEPILDTLDRDRFQLHAYAELRVGDEMTRSVESRVDGWRVTTAKPPADVAAMVRHDGIDILVDIAGHTAGNRLDVFAHRAAPVQASYLGYACTTGVPGADYFIADPFLAPFGTDHLFSETVVRLPDSFLVYTGPADRAPAAETPWQRNGYVTFGSPTRLVRINGRVLDAWAEILRRLPDARLLVDSVELDRPFTQDLLRRRLARHGLPMERVVIGRNPDYWSFFDRIDVQLDCFPHNSGTTTAEALWMGVPVVSLVDRPPVGRVGASLLAAAGRREWIAWSTAEYVGKAVRLASRPQALVPLRAELSHQTRTSPLADGARFTRSFERALRAMWDATASGRPDQPLWIAAED